MAKDVPDSLKMVLYRESGYQCAYCGHREGLDLTVQHIIPRSEGGPTNYENLIVLCHNCHHRVDETGRIKPGEIRRLKRHFVARFFTQIGVNAARIAHSHPAKLVAVAPVSIQHLVDLRFFEPTQETEWIEWSKEDGDAHNWKVTTMAIFRLTDEGESITAKWLLRDDDLGD